MARRRKSERDEREGETKLGRQRSNNRGIPEVRNAANARERCRMRVLSKAFSRLKTTLPWVPADTKLSKLDTLRLASCYIAHLKQILQEDDAANGNIENAAGHENGSPTSPELNSPNSNTVHPLNLTWPFSFNKSGGPNGSDKEQSLKLPTQTEILAGSS